MAKAKKTAKKKAATQKKIVAKKASPKKALKLGKLFVAGSDG